MDELLAQFLIEGPDLVNLGADALLALERQPDNRAGIDEAFRAVHTLKGSVGLFDLPAMARVLHAAEDVLAAVRDDERAVDPMVIRRLMAVLDQTQTWLEALETSGVLPGDATDRAERLLAQLTQDPLAPDDRPTRLEHALPDWAVTLGRELPPETAAAGWVALRYEPHAGCYFNGDDPLAVVAQTPGLLHLKLSLRSDPPADGPYDPFTCDLLIDAAFAAPLVEVKAAYRFVMDQVRVAEFGPSAVDDPGAPAERTPEAAGRTLHVDPRRVEALAALVDELVTAKTGLAAVVAMARSGAQPRELADALAAQHGAIDRLVGQAHQRVMALRMAPVRPFLRRFPRVVREMAESLGKDVELAIEGDGVEADRGVVEGLFEPLTHLLRNAVDHGVESPEERRQAGKRPRAVITLSALERSGQLRLTVRDDGRGVDPERIRAVAARRGLIDADRLQAMEDAAVIDLIFLPGFSTAGAVTALSGRGVGMDAIRSAVHRLGGKISVATDPGAGTTVELRLPLTVSLTKVMVVSHADERYGVPMNDVLETLRLRPEQVVAIRAGHAFNWRDQTVPLVPLSSLTGGAPALTDGDQRVLVVRSGAQAVGLAIDAIEDRLDVAMRPLDGLLAGVPGLAGTTVLGDGQVLMILDPEALVG